MKWVLLLVGVVVGFVGGAAAVLYLQQGNKENGEMSIIFAKKLYYENANLVTVSGTLTGSGMAA